MSEQNDVQRTSMRPSVKKSTVVEAVEARQEARGGESAGGTGILPDLLLAAIVESSEDSIVSKTLDGTITSWNKGAERLYGYIAAETVGQPISILIPDGRPDELPEILRRLARGERIEHYETVRRRKDGTLLDVSVSISPIRNARNEIIGAAAITRDISARKAAEVLARFQLDASIVLASLDTKDAILEKVGTLVVPFLADGCLVDVADRDGGIRRVAISHADPDRLAILNELDRSYPVATITGRGPSNVIRTGEPELRSDVPDSMLVSVAQDEAHLRMLRALGPRSYVSVPLLLRDDAVGAITFLATDTRRRFTTNDLRIAEDLAVRTGIALENARLYGELREADRRKDEFLAILAHELRNPLAPIRSAVEVMRLKNPQDRELEAVRDIIDRQTRQMSRLVDDLLDISRISHGRIELRKKHVTIDSIFESAVESSRPLIEAREHELTVSLPDEPLWLNVDSTRLAQVILNLLNNAAKFTPPGGKIWLTAAREQGHHRDTDRIVITVRDTGIGIPDEMKDRIFELFTQGDRSLERSQGGLGVGLTLVRSLLQLHGGTIDVHSAGAGEGTEFTVRLPLSPPRQERAVAEDGERERLQQPARRRILIVDDNAEQAVQLEGMLAEWGHEVQVARDGGAATVMVSALRPQMVLVDVGRASLDGYEIVRRLKGCLNGVLLVSLSGRRHEEYVTRSRAAGFHHHLVKPVEAERLQGLLTTLPNESS